MSDLVKNSKAFFNYSIEDTLEAGIVLKGTEIKSLRQGHASLDESYGTVRNGEVWICNASIEPYAMGNIHNHKPKRERKLLLKKREINLCKIACSRKSMTLIPIRIYLVKGWAKVRLAIAKGKNTVDKRNTIRHREEARNMQRAVRRWN